MQKNMRKKNMLSILIVASLILTSTLSVATVNVDYGVKESDTLKDIEYSDVEYLYSSESDGISFSNNINLDEVNSFELLPEEGQQKIIGGQSNLETLREKTISRIQTVKDRISERLSSRSSSLPLLSKLFGIMPSSSSQDHDPVSTDTDVGDESSQGTSDTDGSEPLSIDSIMSVSSNGDGNDSDSNVTIVPEYGDISISISGSGELNIILDINGTLVTVISSFVFGTDSDLTYLHILWNLSEGYFEITTDGYLEFNDLYLNINDNIIFVTDSFVLDAFGHIMIDHRGYEGDLSLDGVLALEGLTFDINVNNFGLMGGNVSVGASFDFSKMGEADSLSLSWGEGGIVADGNFVGSSELNIYDFSVEFTSSSTNIAVSADHICLHNSVVLEFIEDEDEGVVMCRITSHDLTIQGLYLAFGETNLFVDSITVNVDVELILENIDADQYITEEEGHISIGGCFALSIDTTLNVEGIIVDISGVLKLDYGYLNIEWDKAEGFFKISATKIVEIDDFSISIDGEWISLGWDEFIIFTDGYLMVEELDDLNNSAHLVMDKCSEITGIYFNGAIGENDASLSIGSIVFVDGSLFEVTLYNNTVILDLDASLGYGLILHDLDVAVMGFEIEIAAIIVMGTWHVQFSDQLLDIQTDGFIEILGLEVSSNSGGISSTMLTSSCITASGETEIKVIGGKVIFAAYDMDAFLNIGLPGLGAANVELYGDARLVIDLINGTVYASIDGYGNVGFAGMGLTASVSFEGHADISLVGDALTISASFTAGISATMGLSMALLNNFNIGMMIGVSGYVSGSVTAYLNLTTGEFHYEGNVIVVVLVHVSDISGYGENVWLHNDDFYLRIDEILVDFMDSDIYAWVCIHVSISDMGMGMGMSDVIIWGNVQGSATIDGIYLRTKSSFPIPFELYIEHIEFDADFIIHPSSISLTNMLGGSNVYVEGSLGLTIEGLEWTYIAGTHSSPTTVTISFGEIELESGHLDIQLQGSEIRIDGTGTYLSLNDFDLDGVITLEDGSKIIPSGTIDLIQFASESSLFTIYYNSEGTENGEELIIVVDGGDGLINIDGVENLGATLYDADGNPGISGSVDIDSIDLTLEGYVKVYTDGTIEANCAGTFSVENLDIDFDQWNDLDEDGVIDDGEISHIDFLVTNVDIAFGGEIIIHPGDKDAGKPPVVEVNGYVAWDADGDLESEGSIYVDGRITVDWEREIFYNPETGEWEEGAIWYVDIKFDSVSPDDSGVYISHFSLDTIIPGIGPIKVNIVNYWGTGMFEFSINTHTQEIFMENQVDGVWEDFSFDYGDGFVTCEVFHFWGDLTLRVVDKIPYIESEEGSQSYLGIRFSTNIADDDPNTYDGLDWMGDLCVTLVETENGLRGEIHVTNIHLEPGTNGILETYSDAEDPNIMHVRLVVFEGQASMTVFLGDANKGGLWLEITAEDGNPFQIKFPKNLLSIGQTFGNLANAWNAFLNGEGTWEDFSEEFSTLMSQIRGFLNIIREAGFSNGVWIGLTNEDGQTFYEWYQENKNLLPDDIRKEIEDLFNEINDDSCFLEGTRIEMLDGSLKNIEEITVGDQVASYDFANDVWTTGVVTEVFHHTPEEMTDYYLVLNDDLRITPNHPIMVDGKWIDAGELNIGDDFGGNIISSIEYVYKRVPTYNFEVAIYHTYNVVWGESAKSVVHNPINPVDSGPSAEISTKQSVVQKAVSGDKNPCFLEDTKIGMANGSTKYIQDIELGDQVLSYDIENETWTNGTVVEVDHHTADEMPSYYMVINNDLRVTPNHPVYVKSGNNYQPNPTGPGLTALNEGNGKWIAAGDLQVGQELDGQVITSIRQVYHRVPTYNFKVEPYHNYRVVWGETNSIAHENESLLEVESEEPDTGAPGHPYVSNPPINPPDVTNPWGDKDQSCFVAGTQVEMSDGSLKNIEDIQVGDSVKSYDEESGEQKMGFVSNVFHHMSSEMTDYYMIINNALGITPNHPVYINNEWIDAGDIRIGDDFGGNTVSSIKYVYERVPTYNIEVEPYHTYNVIWGENANSVVHNFEAESGEIQTSTIQRVLTSDKKKPTCFLEDTKIQMNDGSSKDIQDIKIGDVVRAFDTETDSWKSAEVVEVFHHSAEEMVDYYLIINDDLRITPNHPVYVDNKWIEAGDLKVGDVFGGELITSIKKVFEKVPTYNFDVEPYHTYNVIWGSSDESIVHNDDILGGSDPSTGSSTIYTKKTVISGTKYGTVDVADSGLKATIKVSNIMEFEPFQMVSKTYKDIAGQKVVVNEDKYVLTEDGILVEVDDNQGWSVKTDDDSSVRNYGVQKNQETVQDGLETIDEVKTYIRENVVNSNSHSGSDDDDGSCCFPAGTLISMADGAKKPIEKICIGEYVLSYDTNSGVFVTNVVKEMVSPIRKGVYNINNGLIYPTDDHPFYTMKADGTIGWASIDPVKSEFGYLMTPMVLEVGDSVFTISQGWVVVDSIEYIEGSVQTFNLEDVSGVSNFFANDVLVHNAVECAHPSPQQSEPAGPTTTFSMVNFYGDGVDTPVDMANGIPVQFTTGGNFITFGNIGVSGMTEIFVVNKMDIYPPGAFDWEDDDGLDAIPRPDFCCFPAGTSITMSDGSLKNIEDIEVNDIVCSYDLENDIYVHRPVTDTIIKQRNEVYDINDGLVMPTDDHPLYVKKADGRVGWAAINAKGSKVSYLNRDAMPLEVGDWLFTSSDWVRVDSIVCKPGDITTYTFTVDDVHNYFANNVLVSNAVKCQGPDIESEPFEGGKTPITGGGSIKLSSTSQSFVSYSCDAGQLPVLMIPIAITMDNIYYPAESITPGDIIKAYNAETHQLVDALVTDISMSLTEGKYVDVELMQYSAFQNYEQQINDLESYLEKSGSDGSTITPLKLDPCKKIFFGVDQFVKTTNGLVKAKDLQIGDRITGYKDGSDTDGPSFVEYLAVSSIQIKRRVIPVYNITLNNMPIGKEIDVNDPFSMDDDSSSSETDDGNDIRIHDGSSHSFNLLGFSGSSSDEKGDSSTETADSAEYIKYQRLRNYLEYIGVQYDDSAHYYLADGILVGDYIAGTDANSDGYSSVGFPVGTKITMVSSDLREGSSVQLNKEYYKDIRDVEVGDTVLAYDTKNDTLVKTNASVLEVCKHVSEEYLSISLSIKEKPDDNSLLFSLFSTPLIPEDPNGGASDEEHITLKVAPDHPVYIYLSSNKDGSISFGIKKAADLETGDMLYISNGEKATVDSIEFVESEITTTNIIVENYHSYFADDILVDDTYNIDKTDPLEEDSLEKPKSDDPSVSLESSIKITVLDDKTSVPGYTRDTICFDYYNEADYGYFKENSGVQISTGKISTVISNMIKMLVEKFPTLAKFKFFERYLEDDENDDTEEPSETQDDPADEQEDTTGDGDTSPAGDDDTGGVPDEETPVEGDTSIEGDDEVEETSPEETEPGEEQDDEAEEDPIVLPIPREPALTSLQRDLLNIIEEDSEDPDELIHYIWDFGDGTYKYGINVTHNYGLDRPETLTNEFYNSFSGYSSTSETFDEIVTYLVTLLIVDKYGNIVDMDMTSVTMEYTWSVDSYGYSLISYSINF